MWWYCSLLVGRTLASSMICFRKNQWRKVFSENPWALFPHLPAGKNCTDIFDKLYKTGSCCKRFWKRQFSKEHQWRICDVFTTVSRQEKSLQNTPDTCTYCYHVAVTFERCLSCFRFLAFSLNLNTRCERNCKFCLPVKNPDVKRYPC